DVAIIISQLRHLLFFFCSRRRHTRFSRDWSSDVCSSDLEVLRRFVDWIAGYTVSPAGSVLRLAIRAPGALEPARMRTAYVLAEARPARMTPARERVVEVAGDGFARTVRELAEEAGVSDGVVRGLVDAGTLLPVDVPTEAPFDEP